jgi:stage V sporulation protein G
MTALKITHCAVYPVANTENAKLKAFARIVLNDELQLTSLRVYAGVSGLFVSYPNDPHHKGEDYRQLFYPVSKELRDHIEEIIIKEYNRPK